MKGAFYEICFVLLICFLSSSVLAQSSLKKLEDTLGELVAPANAPTASTEPPYLGVVVDDAADGTRGAVVLGVTENGPAALAGLRVADRIIAINGKVIGSVEDMGTIVTNIKVGEAAVFEVSRAGESRSVEVTLAERPANAGAPGARVSADPLPAPVVPRIEGVSGRPILGVNVFAITEEARLTYGLPVRSGALIGNVHPDSPAERAELRTGNAIVAIDGSRVDSPTDLVNLLSSKRPGDAVEIAYYEGSRLFRKSVQLGGTPAAETPSAEPPRERSFKIGPLADDRPALRRIEGLIDRLAGTEPPREVVPSESEVTTLRRQVGTLQKLVEQLQERIRQLEERLAKE